MDRLERIEEMKNEVYQANVQLPQLGLVKLTWGNASLIDRDLKVIVIKPSGVNYKTMTYQDMVVTDLDGNLILGQSLRPSSDLMTHVTIYKEFKDVNAVIHTHSTNAVAWSQSGRDLPVYGTTHADSFYGSVPNTRYLNLDEVESGYELNTGKLIVETFMQRQLRPLEVPGILVNGHGPFTWGKTLNEAVNNSLILDEICLMAMKTEQIEKAKVLPQHIIDKHYQRKHGEKAYYGQK